MIRAVQAVALLCAAIVVGCVQTQSKVEFAPQPQSDESQLQRKVRLHVELGAGYYTRGQYEVALEELNEAVRLDPNYGPAHNILGLVYSQLKEVSRAETEFT